MLPLFTDRIQWNSIVIIGCFVSVLLLGSQSAASYPTYILALTMLLTARLWNDVFREPLAWLILITVGYLAASALWSVPASLREVISYSTRALLVALFVVAFAECQLRGQLHQWLGRALGIAGALAAFVAIVVFYLTQPEDGRLNGLGQLDTHVVAALVFSTTLIYLLDSLAKEQSRIWIAVYFVSILTIVVAVALSDSRNAWVSLLLGAGVFLLATRVKHAAEFAICVAVMALLIAVVLLGLYMSEGTRELVLPRGDSFRITIWTNLISKVVASNPWFGLGIATSDNLFVEGLEFLHPHNMYLAVFYQGGIVGLALFLGVIIATVATLLTHYHVRDAKVALGILTITLSSYLLDGHELVDKVGETWFMFWLPVAVALGLRWHIALNAQQNTAIH